MSGVDDNHGSCGAWLWPHGKVRAINTVLEMDSVVMPRVATVLSQVFQTLSLAPSTDRPGNTSNEMECTHTPSTYIDA